MLYFKDRVSDYCIRHSVSRNAAKRRIKGKKDTGIGSEAQKRGAPVAGLMTKRRKRRKGN